MTNWEQNCIGRWSFRKRNAAGLFVNEMNPGTGDLTPTSFSATDTELVDMDIGQGLDINANNKRLLAADGSYANFTSQDFSLETWVFLTGIGVNRGIITKANGGVGYAIYSQTTGNIVFGTYGSGGWDASTAPAGTIVVGQWLHIVASKSGTSGIIYMNGRNVTTVSAVHQPLLDNTANILNIFNNVGLNWGLFGYGGRTMIYEGRALSAADAAELASLGPNRT